MVETGITAHQLSASWTALGTRAAVASGALAALLSLFHDTPLWVASLRGSLVWLAVLVLVLAGRAWLSRSIPASKPR